MKKRDIVKDDQGHHYAVMRVNGSQITVSSVATKEVFVIPKLELTVVPGLVER